LVLYRIGLVDGCLDDRLLVVTKVLGERLIELGLFLLET
jgi:hypothetical protein